MIADFKCRFEIYSPHRSANPERPPPNFSDTIVSVHLHQALTTIERFFLNLIDGFIYADVSDMLRSSPSPVDENIPIIIAFVCVVSHVDFLWLATSLERACKQQSKLR